jgi:23S rRNA (cytosine1962-C5)-methyltransferase
MLIITIKQGKEKALLSGATAIVQSIAARAWTLREDKPVGHALIKRRVQAAVLLRAERRLTAYT